MIVIIIIIIIVIIIVIIISIIIINIIIILIRWNTRQLNIFYEKTHCISMIYAEERTEQRPMNLHMYSWAGFA